MISIIFSLSLVLCLSSNSSAKESAAKLYQSAKSDYYSLKKSRSKQAKKSNWTRVKNKFLQVSNRFPKSALADDALFTAGILYYDSYKKFGSKNDLNAALLNYKKVAEKYSHSSLADDALFRIGDINFYDLKKYSEADKAYSKVIKEFSKGDMVAPSLKRLKALSSLYKPRTAKQKKQVKVKTIVIDPGHGGKDGGAKGQRGLTEKKVVLDISLKLKKILEKQPGYKVILTRKNDIFIPLEERTAIANDRKADIFVSIHANASERKKASGIETYYLDFAKSDVALETAARENKTPFSDIGDDVQYILADMVANTKMNESSQLAGIVQNSLISGIKRKFKKIRNLKAKGGPFYVLHGANMPSILVETSFISNRVEEKRLGTSQYRKMLAYYIFKGIEKYFKEIQIAHKTE